ncbi:hypothetical protein Tco_0109585 [Tanacetum coccineum]
MFKITMASKSYEKHPAHKELYDALIQSIFIDKDDMDRLVVDHASQKKRRHEDKDEDPSAGSNQGKGREAKEKILNHQRIEEDTHEVGMDVEEPVQENVVNDVNQPQDDDRIVNDQPQQTWFNNLVSAEKDPLTFDELMATPIDFSKFAINRLKLDKITKADLDGPIYNLLKGTCQSSIELEYNMEECYKALSNQLDWENPEGHKCPFDLSKPLPLKGRTSHLTILVEYLFNNDLVYLTSGDLERKYTTSITKTKAARYDLVDIEDMILNQWSKVKVGYNKDAECGIKHGGPQAVTVNKLYGYGYLKEIMVRRADRNLYKFKEDETLKKVRDTLHHRLFNFRLGYIKDMPRRKWSAMDNRRSGIMVKLIDELMLERRIMRNLERLVRGRPLEMDYRLMQHTNIRVILHSIHSDDGNPTSANIKQALRQAASQGYLDIGKLNTN